jgi:hypothetical protein
MKKLSEKIKVILTLAGIIAFIAGALILFARHTSKTIAARIEHVNKGYEYGKGVIVDMKYYKGHSLEVKYQIAGKDYLYSGGWDKNSLDEGDSIKFRYALDAPELIITELENEY